MRFEKSVNRPGPGTDLETGKIKNEILDPVGQKEADAVTFLHSTREKQAGCMADRSVELLVGEGLSSSLREQKFFMR
jgi:hypothetical protein